MAKAKPKKAVKSKPRKRGRPSTFKGVDLEYVERLATAGLTNVQIAVALGIHEDTVYDWLKAHPEFSEAVKRGKSISDDKVEKSLYARATGYAHPDVHISNFQGIPIVTKITKFYPPDPASMIFWLKNRRPEKWREKVEVTDPGRDSLIKQVMELGNGVKVEF